MERCAANSPKLRAANLSVLSCLVFSQKSGKTVQRTLYKGVPNHEINNQNGRQKDEQLMQKKHNIEIGNKYGLLTVTGDGYRTHDGKRWRYLWPCVCECGEVSDVRGDKLVNGNTRSCGCLRREVSTKHGLKNHPLYSVWHDMHRRCSNPAFRNWKHYGGRGITVCDQWKDPARFVQWALANGWQKGLLLDRRDNDGNYEPRNCRFVDALTSNRNKNNNRMVSAFGETKCASEWVEDERCTVCYETLHSRLKNGWKPEEAITKRSLRDKS